jgi:hypothetical protein
MTIIGKLYAEGEITKSELKDKRDEMLKLQQPTPIEDGTNSVAARAQEPNEPESESRPVADNPKKRRADKVDDNEAPPAKKRPAAAMKTPKEKAIAPQTLAVVKPSSNEEEQPPKANPEVLHVEVPIMPPCAVERWWLGMHY